MKGRKVVWADGWTDGEKEGRKEGRTSCFSPTLLSIIR